MKVPTLIATDDAVLGDLLDLRRAGLPAWQYIHSVLATRTVSIRLASPADLGKWHSIIGFTAPIVPEPYPASGIIFHYTNVVDWHPGWTFYLTAVDAMFPGLPLTSVGGR